MPDRVAGLMEKGFFGVLALVCTTAVGAIMFHFRSDAKFRELVDTKVSHLHTRINEHSDEVHKNHPSNVDFQRMIDSMNTRFDSLDQDVREVREALL